MITERAFGAIPVIIASVAVVGTGSARRRSRCSQHEAGEATSACRVRSTVLAIFQAGSSQGDSTFVVADHRDASSIGSVELSVILGGAAGEAVAVAVTGETVEGAGLACAVVKVVVLPPGAHTGRVVSSDVG
jgi:hypothetical protein